MTCSDHIIQVLSGIVGAVSEKKLAALKSFNPDINAISFMYGSSNEMIETLAQKDKSPNYKYNIWPSIMLFLDLSANISSTAGQYPEYTLQMAIVMPTDPTYKCTERYENVFEPILYPLWQELITQIADSGCFSDYRDTIKYTKYDRPYWGRQGNTLAEVVDAIELKDLKLKLLPNAKARIVNPSDSIFADTFYLDIFA